MNETNSPKPAERSRSAWPLILILIVVVVPILAAYVAYYTGFGVAQDTVNEGTLLQPPVALDTLPTQGEPLPLAQANRWHLLIPVVQPCEQACQNNLYVTRQVHIRLGEKAKRIDRIAVNLAGAEGEQYLESVKAEHPLLTHVTVDPAHWQQWLAGTNAPQADSDFYLLADPQGYAMMFYTAEHHGNQLLDDLKRILRYTPE